MSACQIQSPRRDLYLVEPSGTTPAPPAAMKTREQISAVNQTASDVMHGRCITQGHSVTQDQAGQVTLRVRLTSHGMSDQVIWDLRSSLPDVRLELIMASARCVA